MVEPFFALRRLDERRAFLLPPFFADAFLQAWQCPEEEGASGTALKENVPVEDFVPAGREQ